jgi:hypothetical protein
MRSGVRSRYSPGLWTRAGNGCLRALARVQWKRSLIDSLQPDQDSAYRPHSPGDLIGRHRITAYTARSSPSSGIVGI